MGKNNFSGGPAVLIAGVAGFIGGFIIDCMKISKFDDAYFDIMGYGYFRQLLITHFLLFFAIIGSLIAFAFVINKPYLFQFFLITIALLLMAYTIVYGILVFAPSNCSSQALRVRKKLANNLTGYEARVIMKRLDIERPEEVVEKGYNFIYEKCDYESVEFDVMFYLGFGIHLISATSIFWVPYILCCMR